MSSTTTSIGYFKIDGKAVANPSAITFSRNKVWDTDAGRTQSGEFTGKIIAIKKKIEVTWNTLTESQAQTISELVDNKTAFHTIDYYDVTRGEPKQFTAYFGDGSYPYYGYDLQKRKRVNGLKIDGIQK